MPRYTGMPTATARAFQSGAPDAYGNPPERAISDGSASPCRHCLRMIPAGAPMLILAHRPFTALQPYAETGPIFLCAEPCAAPASAPDGTRPEVLTASPDYLLKGYSDAERIVYGTGRVVVAQDLPAYADEVLARPDIAFVDVRSARNNCWLARLLPG